jgi:hypothetical protein
MQESYTDARLKVKRAKKHIADFTAAVIALEDSCISTIESLPHGGQSLKHEVPGIEVALRELSLISGDAIHNLNSALDFAWHSTISRCLPERISRYTKFPVYEKKQDLVAALNGIEADKRSPRLFDCIVTQIQPYKGGRNSIVLMLHKLDISDKHTLTLNLSTFTSAEGISVRDAAGDLHHGATMGTIGSRFFVDFYPGFQVEHKGKLSLTVTIEQADIFKTVPGESLLSTLANVTLNVLHALERV